MSERKQIAHYKIMDYWRDKAICKNGEVITDAEASKRKFVDTIPVVEDWGEPMCWGCSKPIIGEYEKNCETKLYDEEDIKNLWSDKKVKSKLNRCHVVPVSLDGSDEPDNLFLMCESCHFLSPDSLNAKGFFRWVYRQRNKTEMGFESIPETFRLIDEELTDRGLPAYSEMFKQCPNMITTGSKKFLTERISTHSSKLVTSTLIVAFADWLEIEYRKAMLEKIAVLS